MRHRLLISLIMTVVLAWAYEVQAFPSNEPPVAVIEPPYHSFVLSGQTLTFDSYYSYDPDGGIVSTEWDVGGGYYSNFTIEDGTTDDDFEVSFTSSGYISLWVELEVEDNMGAHGVTYHPIYLMPSFDTPASSNEVVVNGDFVEIDLPALPSDWMDRLWFKVVGGEEHVNVYTSPTSTTPLTGTVGWPPCRYVPCPFGKGA